LAIAREGPLAGDQLVQDDAEAVDIGPAIDLVRLATRLLGRQVGGRVDGLAVKRHRGLIRVALGQAEVGNLRGQGTGNRGQGGGVRQENI